MSTAAREEAERRWPVHVEGEDKPLPTETRRLQREAFIAGWEARDAQVADLVIAVGRLLHLRSLGVRHDPQSQARHNAAVDACMVDIEYAWRALSDPGEGGSE